MANISDVIKRLEHLKSKHGDLKVKAFGYHSDYQDDLIDYIESSIRFHFLGEPVSDDFFFFGVGSSKAAYMLIGGGSE